MTGNPVFCTPLNTPPDFHSLWGWLDFTQTCLARRMIFLTGGLTSPISRAATAHSEWTSPHKLAAGGELERTGGRALTHLWRWFSIDHWQPTSKTPLWTWQAASATAFESSAHFYQDFMVYLEVIFFFFFFAAPGIWFDCTSQRWHGNSRRSLLDVDIYGTCIFMSAWCYSTWQPLILAPLIPEEF